jgi:Retrotransposon gag protein
MRERANKPKVEWSDRTTRVFSSYNEMSKAIIQVFGDIDERKTAARKLQQLRQTTSVRNYITEFQTITANLDWDDEALEDKFQEGLKQNIRDALIYFPIEHENLEELFERAQIDREQWSQKERRDARPTRYFSKRNTIMRDRQGDVIMTDAWKTPRKTAHATTAARKDTTRENADKREQHLRMGIESEWYYAWKNCLQHTLLIRRHGNPEPT